jgi:hypothetical protein
MNARSPVFTITYCLLTKSYCCHAAMLLICYIQFFYLYTNVSYQIEIANIDSQVMCCFCITCLHM